MAQAERDFESEVLARISEGESMRAICADLRDFGCPSAATFHARVLNDKSFAERYARARDMQYEAWSDLILEKSANSQRGEKTETDAEGKIIKVTTGDTVERSKLEVDALKWLLAKLHPKRYGDRVQQEITGAEGGPLVVKWQIPQAPQHPTPPKADA